MNLASLRKATGQRVQLVPVACRLDPTIDDAWLVTSTSDNLVTLQNPRTGHVATLGQDHIHHYTSNPSLTQATGITHGFFTLNVQVYLQLDKVSVVPTGRPGERVPPPPAQIVEKIVNLSYPSDSGIQARLLSEGYSCGWCRESRLASKLEIDGCELVIVKTTEGVHNTYRLHDRPEDQILIKKRS
jgi:hypothetical protein